MHSSGISAEIGCRSNEKLHGADEQDEEEVVTKQARILHLTSGLTSVRTYC